MDKHAPTYCPQCSTTLESQEIEGRARPFCPSCQQPIYRNPKPCAGVVVVEEDQLLLVKRSQPPRLGMWSVPAGFLEYDEPPEIGAARELKEETGIDVEATDLELFNTVFVTTEIRENVLVILYRIRRSQTKGEVKAGSDAAAAQFWTRTAFENADEAIDPSHRNVFKQALADD